MKKIRFHQHHKRKTGQLGDALRSVFDLPHKYPLGTIHLLLWLHDVRIRNRRPAVLLLWLADSTWINAQRYRSNVREWLTNWVGVPELLDTFDSRRQPEGQPLRFPIQDVYRFDERRILAGRVESGTLRVGDRLIFSPGGKSSVVKTIERWNAPSRDHALAGESVGVTLTEQIFVERGAIASHDSVPPYELIRLKARYSGWGASRCVAAAPLKSRSWRL